MTHRKKLIEVALPLDEINAESAYEKLPGIGPHPRGIHLWWARRPLAACRAVLFGSLVDDPSNDLPENEAQIERERLFDIIRELVKWENSSDENVLGRARKEIMRSTGVFGGRCLSLMPCSDFLFADRQPVYKGGLSVYSCLRPALQYAARCQDRYASAARART